MTNQITYEIISLSTLAASSKFESAQDNLKNSKPWVFPHIQSKSPTK